MALLEETVTDPDTGRIANATFSDYLVAVNADVPDMEVHRRTTALTAPTADPGQTAHGPSRICISVTRPSTKR